MYVCSIPIIKEFSIDADVPFTLNDIPLTLSFVQLYSAVVSLLVKKGMIGVAEDKRNKK